MHSYWLLPIRAVAPLNSSGYHRRQVESSKHDVFTTSSRDVGYLASTLSFALLHHKRCLGCEYLQFLATSLLSHMLIKAICFQFYCCMHFGYPCFPLMQFLLPRDHARAFFGDFGGSLQPRDAHCEICKVNADAEQRRDACLCKPRDAKPEQCPLFATLLTTFINPRCPLIGEKRSLARGLRRRPQID